MKKIFRIVTVFAFLVLFYLMLSHPAESLYYAFTGLTLWFQKMIPTLFPFMILSGILVRMNLTEYFAKVLSPILKPVFKVSNNGVYCMLLGFLCGFPMGAKVIADLYERQKISYGEASWLLAFCNNIGPIYFMSFVMPLLGLESTYPYLFGMYGLPLLYGLLLRHKGVAKTTNKVPLLCACSTENENSLLLHVDASILSAIEAITKLGGYMILFNLLNLFAAHLFPEHCLPVINALLEITGGISRMGSANPVAVLILLPFGGFSCIAQTYSLIKDTGLSIRQYCVHKGILAIITAIYYAGWFLLHKAIPEVPFLS